MKKADDNKRYIMINGLMTKIKKNDGFYYVEISGQTYAAKSTSALIEKLSSIFSNISSMNIKTVIIEMCRQYVKNHGENPTQLHLTLNEEAELESLRESVLGELSNRILNDGVRDAIEQQGNQLMGLYVFWDAPEFKVN